MKTSYFLIPILLILAGTLTYSRLSEAKKPVSKERAVRTVPVITGTVEQHDLAQSLSLVGKLDAEQSVFIAPQIAGKIRAINISSDQEINEGQLLIQLDDAKAQAALAETASYLADEKRKLKEFSKLISRNAITQTEIDAQKANVDMATARLAAAQADLDYHYLIAPFSGTAGLVDFSQGKMVTAGTELITLDDLSSMRLDLQVPEHYLALLSPGMTVVATSRAWPDTHFTGEVIAIDSRVNQDTLNLRVRVQFTNPNHHLKPGMMMSATLVFPTVSEPVIPVQALEYSGTNRFVYVIGEDNIAKRTKVTLGARIDNEVLITNGLTIGDKVVVQGLVNMRDGLRVEDLTTPSVIAKEAEQLTEQARGSI
ncbi:efflux transporter periplasmic adaptor subunit [Shewanella sp. Choline-02u-19]|uniref:efflux RND transporter periplasmic adaptor subunit n=1 Tax=unclassified Shewanella TaxID=196818 RepID=UPI000C3351DE|nr:MULTISPECIES: efflux RND transporter periplasmic adaptor subunit [unclassified Shewanella]PKH57384.1 efflux transporter periplasmic adaptor subunit [Shewanella sp. Bg11-22]PKI28315.1 efflux transporter periplasmic adaptor subunit [Shewanella sp. Choline-02u-19]